MLRVLTCYLYYLLFFLPLLRFQVSATYLRSWEVIQLDGAQGYCCDANRSVLVEEWVQFIIEAWHWGLTSIWCFEFFLFSLRLGLLADSHIDSIWETTQFKQRARAFIIQRRISLRDVRYTCHSNLSSRPSLLVEQGRQHCAKPQSVKVRFILSYRHWA